MTGHRCSACRQSPRLLSLLVLASFMTFATPARARHCCAAPEIITYGGCPHRLHQLPYQIQTPLSPTPAQPPSSCIPPERKSYGYSIDGPADPYHPSNSGFQLPVSIQEPLLPAQPPAHTSDPLRGKSYGVGIEPGPSSPHYSPSLGQYHFGIQNPVPGAKPAAPVDTSDPYRVQVQPAAVPNQGSPLWGPMPIGIEHPVEGPAGPGPAGPAPRLTGLTSSVDKLLLPIYCPIPMDGQGGGPAGGYSGGGGPAGGYSGGGGPAGGYSGGGGPAGSYSGGGGPAGPGGYSGGSGPAGPGCYSGGSGPGGGYSSCSCL